MATKSSMIFGGILLSLIIYPFFYLYYQMTPEEIALKNEIAQRLAALSPIAQRTNDDTLKVAIRRESIEIPIARSAINTGTRIR